MALLNHTTLELLPAYAALNDFILSLPQRFREGEGTLIHNGRNQLRRISYEGVDYVVKSFRRPNVVNRWVYGTLRASKAKRSLNNALLLQSFGIGTPQPVGYLNIRHGLSFGESYFVTIASTCPYRYEDLFTHNFPYADKVLRAIGELTALLHSNRLAHKDYGRANILFEELPDGQIRLELVDLNRMYHGELDITKGCKNFERLPATPHMHKLLAEGYATARGFDAEECFRLMQQFRSTQPGKIDGKY